MLADNESSYNLKPRLRLLSNKLQVVKEASGVISIFIYPIEECYKNILNIYNKEYLIRSIIRLIVITSAFIISPILIELANFSWLKTRASSLYEAIPIFNLLPYNVGTNLCGAYLTGYFFAWGINQITNLYTNFKFGGKEHYLTTTKTIEIYERITNNQFNVSREEIKLIFQKINQQWLEDPKNNLLLNMLLAIRNADFQTVLDNYHLLETKIAIIEYKIKIINASNNHLNLDSNVTNLFNNYMIFMPENLNSEAISRMHNRQLNNSMQLNENATLSSINSNSETTWLQNLNNPQINGILYQYDKPKNKNSKINLIRENNSNEIIIQNLNAHKQQLIEKRYLDPKKNYLIA